MEENKNENDLDLDSFMTDEPQSEKAAEADSDFLDDFVDDVQTATDTAVETVDKSLDDLETALSSAENIEEITPAPSEDFVEPVQAPNSENAVVNEPVLQSSSTKPPARPKLKKIKRLKVRPMSDIPVAPQKANPETNSSEQSFVDDDFNDEFSGNTQGTSLITATDAKDISQDDEFNNSYVLEGLPPELDYVTGDNGEAIYPETGIMAYKKPLIIALGCFLFGMFLGAIFFSTKTEEKHGLEDVVLNSDVPQGRARCGLTDRSQACIFYIMNCYKQELTGRDFFKLAATLTGREEYMIETENLRYATTKIKPGAFAQLNIPALK